MTEEQTQNSENQKNEIEILKEQLTACEKQRDEYLDGWRRAKADFINYKKEEAKRAEEWVRFSNEALVRELITILDSLDLGIAVLPNDTAAQKGIALIKSQLEETLKKYGLEKITAGIGEGFEPTKHEAVAEVATDGPPGMIVEIIANGYMLSSKIIRPTKVKVAK